MARSGSTARPVDAFVFDERGRRVSRAVFCSGQRFALYLEYGVATPGMAALRLGMPPVHSMTIDLARFAGEPCVGVVCPGDGLTRAFLGMTPHADGPLIDAQFNRQFASSDNIHSVKYVCWAVIP